MIDILKKQWFVILIALIFVGFTCFYVYDTNKGKLPGKSIDGKDLIASLGEDAYITADDLYDKIYTLYGGESLVYLKWQQAVIDESVADSDEIEELASTYKEYMEYTLETQASTYGMTLEAMTTYFLNQYGFDSDELDKYCLIMAKVEQLRNNYIEAHLEELFTPLYEERNGRIVAHILVKMEDAQNPTDEEMEKVKAVESALAAGTSFEEVAIEYSDDTSAEAGGYLGYIDSSTEFVESFMTQAMSMKKGEISDWVKESNDSYNGWHKIYVIETEKDAIMGDEDAKDSLYEAIANYSDIAADYMWEAAEKLNITYANDEIKQQIMDTLGIEE